MLLAGCVVGAACFGFVAGVVWCMREAARTGDRYEEDQEALVAWHRRVH